MARNIDAGRELVKIRLAKTMRLAGGLCAVAVLFYCAYTRSYEAVSIVILLVFFTYFLNLKYGAKRDGSLPSPSEGQMTRLPIRELAKALACLVGGGALAGFAGYAALDVQLAVSIALTAVVVGIVGFVLFLLRALNAWQLGRDKRI